MWLVPVHEYLEEFYYELNGIVRDGDPASTSCKNKCADRYLMHPLKLDLEKIEAAAFLASFK